MAVYGGRGGAGRAVGRALSEHARCGVAVVRMLRAFNRATLRTGNEVSALRRSDRMLGMPELLFHAPQTPLAVREEIIELAGAALRERPNPVGGAGLPPAAGGAVQGAEVTGLPPPGGGPAARSRAAPKRVRPKNSPVKSAPRNRGSLSAEAFRSRRIAGASSPRSLGKMPVRIRAYEYLLRLLNPEQQIPTDALKSCLVLMKLS